MHFDLAWFRQTYFHQKVLNGFSLIPLKLDNLSIFGMFYHGAVTSEIFLAHFDDFLEVVVSGKALYCGESFSSVSLLDSYMDVPIVTSGCVIVGCERIADLEILDNGVGHGEDWRLFLLEMN